MPLGLAALCWAWLACGCALGCGLALVVPPTDGLKIRGSMIVAIHDVIDLVSGLAARDGVLALGLAPVRYSGETEMPPVPRSRPSRAVTV